jgi:hypothetical protein
MERNFCLVQLLTHLPVRSTDDGVDIAFEVLRSHVLALCDHALEYELDLVRFRKMFEPSAIRVDTGNTVLQSLAEHCVDRLEEVVGFLETGGDGVVQVCFLWGALVRRHVDSKIELGPWKERPVAPFGQNGQDKDCAWAEKCECGR